MIAFAAVCAVTIVAVVVLALQQRAHREAQAQWAVERRELLNRIQAPGLIPVQPVEGFEIPEREPDEWAKVGQVEISDEWLNGED